MFSIVSAYYRFNIIASSAQDLTWATMPIFSWRFVNLILLLPEYTEANMKSTSPSIAEINIGVLCSCIPVAFVLFKGMTERSITWANHFWNNLTHGYRKAPDSKDAKRFQAKDSFSNQAQDIENLPRVPNATMTGALSFFDRLGRSKAEKTQAAMYTHNLNLTLMSVDHDYHKQLRAGQRR